MKKVLLLVCVLLTSNIFAQNVQITERLARKMQSINPLEYTRVLILLNDRVDIEALDADLYRMNAPLTYRAQTVINTLRSKAEATQGPLLEYLENERKQGKVKQYINYWVTNLIFAEMTSDVIYDLAKRNDIEFLDLDALIELDKPVYEGPSTESSGTESVETGLKVIKADVLWGLGFTGAGRTVMHIDTGVDVLHPALGPKWWGNNGRQWYHAWFDPISPSSTAPFDCGTHGTHTMGTMCGSNAGTGDTVGVAPDARWMAAGVTDCPGASYPSMNIAAFQWAMDPDTNAATMNMPDVISCSWQDPTVSGTAQCTSIYVSTLNAVEAAGIAVCFSAGNSGSGASTITPPKNINTDSVNVFAVGAVDGNTAGYPVASFSSRGPSICGGSGTLLIKPEVSAPGVNVRSCRPGNTYGTSSGTSMASPHVAGAVALLKQVAPNMTGKQIKAILFSTATDLGAAGEDNNYGKGLINLQAALQQMGTFPLNPYNLQSPVAGSRIESVPNSNAQVTFNWDTSATGASYKWIFGSPSVPPRLLTQSSNVNSLTITLGQLDNLLAGLGLAQGDSLVGQWDVWAYKVSPVDSLKAANGPRAITLKRMKPALTPFSLSAPANNSTVLTWSAITTPVNFNWTKSGQAVTYKWFYASPDFSSLSNIKLISASGGSGFDSVLTFRNSQLDSALAGIGISVGQSSTGKWRVYGYSGSDSLSSSQTYDITLRRGNPPTITSSADSIVVSLPVGSNQTTRILTLGNTGEFNLVWSMSESSTTLDNSAKNHDFTEAQLNEMANSPKGAVDMYSGGDVTDGQGGPDGGGYRWIDSDEPGGPVYNWFEISSIGTRINTWTSGSGDDGYVILPLPFSFTYHGSAYTQMKVCTNGWLSFDVASTSSAFSNTAIPSTALPNLALYAFWDDLDLRTTGGVYYYHDAPNSRYIVEYKDVPHYSSGGVYTFQIFLYTDGRIYYQYQNMTSALTSATIGTENQGGTTGLQVVYNAAYVHNNLAIKIEKGLAWVDENPTAGTILPGQNQNVNVIFNSTGLSAGTYTGYIKAGSNDPNTPSKDVFVKLNVTSAVYSTITVVPQAFLNIGPNNLNMKDTVTVFLRNTTSPYAIVDQSAAVIDSATHSGTFLFAFAPTGTYYLQVKHRNSVETWSKSGGELYTQGSPFIYDFTTASTQAYGNNLVQRGTEYCLFSGDINQDGAVDATDVSAVDNDAAVFATGYLATDINGDGSVDATDISFADNNAYNFVSKSVPPGADPLIAPPSINVKGSNAIHNTETVQQNSLKKAEKGIRE